MFIVSVRLGLAVAADKEPKQVYQIFTIFSLGRPNRRGGLHCIVGALAGPVIVCGLEALVRCHSGRKPLAVLELVRLIRS